MKNMNGKLKSKVFYTETLQKIIAEMEKKLVINILVLMGVLSTPKVKVFAPKMMMFPIMEAVRSGGNLENIGGDSKYTKEVVCPDGCVLFKMKAKKLNNNHFYKK